MIDEHYILDLLEKRIYDERRSSNRLISLIESLIGHMNRLVDSRHKTTGSTFIFELRERLLERSIEF